MCGLSGIINQSLGKQQMEDWIRQALIVNSLRGVDSTGMFTVNEDGVYHTAKKIVPGWDFVELDGFDYAMALSNIRFLIGHNRHATRGPNNTLKTAHPVVFENIVLVHNGTLTEMSDLNKDLPTGSYVPHDTTAIAMSLERRGPEATLELLNGSFALIWYNVKDKTLNLARNKERPLFLGYEKDDKAILIASEPKMLTWLADRTKIPIKSVTDVREGTLVTIPLDKKGETKKGKFDFYKPKVYAGVAPYYRGYDFQYAGVGDEFQATFAGEIEEPSTKTVYWKFKRMGDAAFGWLVSSEEAAVAGFEGKPNEFKSYIIKAREARYTGDRTDKKAYLLREKERIEGGSEDNTQAIRNILSYYTVGTNVNFYVTHRGPKGSMEGITADSNAITVRVFNKDIKEGEEYMGVVASHATTGEGNKVRGILILQRNELTKIQLSADSCEYCEATLRVDEAESTDTPKLCGSCKSYNPMERVGLVC